MTWLITGGCGFVGSNIADALLSRGDHVVVLDNLSRTGSRDNLAWYARDTGQTGALSRSMCAMARPSNSSSRKCAQPSSLIWRAGRHDDQLTAAAAGF